MQPLIRVRADILDKLVNEAGEVSIARARLENELGGIRQSLGELSENVARLRSQLREIEMAADSQIEARHGLSREAEAHFDPLEFDRYTRFQELSRMLAESVNDVATVQQNALRNLEDASRDLSRQSKVTRDLQQNLMRIRMVAVRLGFRSPVSASCARRPRNWTSACTSTSRVRRRSSIAACSSAWPARSSTCCAMRSRTASSRAPAASLPASPRPARSRSKSAQEGNEVTLAFSDDGAGLNYARIQARALERGLHRARRPAARA